MRPDDQTTRAFLYCLAVSARRSQVQVIFFLAMSNHYHAGIFDPEGRLPAFLEHFHKLFARHQNALRGRWENFWSSEQTSVVELLEAEDVLNKMVYTLVNPVKAALVARAHEWPGATSLTAHLHGESIRTVRPTVFFRPDGPMPDEELLTVTLPPFMMGEPIEQFRATLRERIAVVEDREAVLRLQTGRRVLGVRAVLRQRWFDRPKTVAPRRKPNPRFACHDLQRRLEAMSQYRAFVAAYKLARERVLAGLEAIFPAGTYWLRRFAGQRCEESPAAT